MPVEINELIIKTKISDTPAPAQSNVADASNTAVNESAIESVEKAVKEIMDILKRKNER